MFNPSMYGELPGPAKMSRHPALQLNEYWQIVNVPKDIPITTALKHIDSFLTKIVALEIPTSFSCNLSCDYCYIRDKWLKNIHHPFEETKRIVDSGIEHLINYKRNPQEEYHLTPWAAEPFCDLKNLEYCMQAGREHHLKVSTSTNGTISTPEVRKILFEAIRDQILPDIQVSLDGPKHIQDRHRKTHSGCGSFESVMNFIGLLREIQHELGIKEDIFHTCGTLELDEDAVSSFQDTTLWFTDRNNLLFSPYISVRFENALSFTKDNYMYFVDSIKWFASYAEEYYNKHNIAIIDHYTNRLFNSDVRVSGCIGCSAMRTQIAVDIDGNLYMCHSPVTSPKLKPRLCFGNLFEGILDYSSVVSNIDMRYSHFLHSSICTDCDLIGKDVPGHLCYSCPTYNLSYNNSFVSFDYFQCQAYKECFPYFKKIYNLYKQGGNKNAIK